MNCRRVRRLLSGDHDGLPIGREADAVATHLQGCPTCCRFRDTLMVFRGKIRELEEWQPGPPANLRAHAIDRWNAACEAPAANRHRGFLSLPPVPAIRRALLGAVTLAVFGAILGLAGWQKGRKSVIPRSQIVRTSPPVPTVPPPRPVKQPVANGPTRRIARSHLTPQDTWGGKVPRSWSLRVPGDPTKASGSRFTWVRRPEVTAGNRGPEAVILQGVPVRQEKWDKLEARIRSIVRVRDDFVQIPFPRIASTSDRQIAAAVESYKREAAIVDPRLSREVTLQQKATALSDLCERLRADTGIQLGAGPSVADEKVTIFCEKVPLRDVMRQLGRPFGYTWLRSGKAGEYRYELVQDLRSQLLEEELRNRDRNAALLALEKEIERFRPYLSLSPDEVLAKAKTAPAAEKLRLEKLARVGWGPIQMYFRLSPQQFAALRAGETLTFSEEPGPGQYPLPKDLARGVLECNRTWRVVKRDDGSFGASPADEDPKSVPLTALPEVRAMMQLTLSQSELGQFTLGGASGFFGPSGSSSLFEGASPYAVGRSPGDSRSEGGAVNSKLIRDLTLRQRVFVQPRPSCNLAPSPPPGEDQKPKVTTADLLEAIHRATQLPIVADFYTRLFKPETVSVKNQPLYEALDQLTQATRLRWNKEESWLQFRSVTYYHDRLKEVPNRFLSRWATARRQQGTLTLDQIAEIAQLPDDQLDGDEMAEGASECWGLREWRLPRHFTVRTHARYLAEFTPAQRLEMMSAAGLPFTKMSLAQQQKFIAFALSGAPLQSIDDLAGATLRVDYTQPGWYQWRKPGDFDAGRWVVSLEPGPKGRRALLPPVRERTREAALQAARRIFPPVTDAMLDAYRRFVPDLTAEKLIPQPEQIAPTELDLVIVYIPGTSNAHPIRWARPNQDLRG